MTDGHIDHTSDGINSKDQADGLCGALYLASKFANEYAYSYGENLDAGLEVSLVQSDSALKTQMITAFESELQRLYFDTWAEQTQANNLLSQQQRAEWERYQDIADGIIIL